MIGILGGTFDPIHFGHLRPALELVEQLQMEEIRFIPSANPPHRWQPEVEANHRLEMVKIAVDAIDKFIVDDREYHRDGASYSVDTLQSIRQEINNKPLCLLLGHDAFLSFTTWKNWQKILTLCHLVVSKRPGYEIDINEHEWIKDRLIDNTNELSQSQAGKVIFCGVTQLDISATEIRKTLKAKKSCEFLTPRSVCNYINEHKLYR